VRKPLKTEVKIFGVPAEFLSGQPPNPRQGFAAWDSLPPHSCIRDLVLESYKYAHRKIRKFQRMPLRILRSLLYGACKTHSNLLALIKINQEAELYVLSFSLHDTLLWLERNTPLKITVSYCVIYI
jgi:hypothetical protein